jgi:hypothetical protein
MVVMINPRVKNPEIKYSSRNPSINRTVRLYFRRKLMNYGMGKTRQQELNCIKQDGNQLNDY